MKQIVFIVAMILTVSNVLGLYQQITPISSNSVNISINSSELSFVDYSSESNTVITHTLALPAADAEISINSMQIGYYDSAGEKLSELLLTDLHGEQLTSYKNRISILNSFTFREMHGFTVSIELASEDGAYRSIIESLDFDVTGIGSVQIPAAISEAFWHSYEALADNFRNSYLANLPFKQPAMLIVCEEMLLDILPPYVRRKKEQGFDVSVVNKSSIGVNASNIQIRDYIADLYRNAANKPDYLLLIGDVGLMPTFFHPPQNDATDMPYALIEGDDYFPEMLVGRVSATSAYQAATVLSKIVSYEQEPYLLEPEWMTKALLVGSHYQTANPPAVFHRIALMLEEAGYDVTEIYWQVGDGGEGTQQIIDMITNGVQSVTWFGFGDANGWHYPQFHIRHLGDTVNSLRMPVVSSFVSNTGDFANPVIDPSVGEYWMRMGTPAEPSGAVSFVGPSDLYTATQYSDVLAFGYHTGILKEGIRSSGSALLRAKMELYRQYPSETGENGWVEHYFKVYNTLSDPSLNLWILVPGEMDIDIPETISAASAHIEFAAPGLTGGYVTVTRDNESYETFKIAAEKVFIPLTADDARNITLSVTAKNHLPVRQIIEVLPVEGVALTSYDFNRSLIMPGELITMNITLKNFADQPAANVTAQLTTFNQNYVNLISPQYNFGELAANQTAQGSFSFEIEPSVPRHTPLQFGINITPAANDAKIQTIVGGVFFNIDEVIVLSGNGVLDPGEAAAIRVIITNEGEIEAVNLRARVISGSNAVTVTGDPLDFGSIAVGENAEASVSVTAAADAYVGRKVYFRLVFEDQQGFQSSGYFNLTLGEVDNTAPTGPCAYGYYAYDSEDINYEQAPVYQWIDIDPDNDAQGEVARLQDDETITMQLPFTFRYYGREYDAVNICSNGWISFPETGFVSFRNYSIPSHINPDGIIAPFWDDLQGLPENDGLIRIATYHEQNTNRFIVSWLDAFNSAELSPEGREKFQIILEPQDGDNGIIIFQYHTVWNRNRNRNYSTQGIQSPCNTMGLQYSFSNSYPPSATPLENGLAIKFTTSPPDNYTLAEDTSEPVLSTGLKQNYPNPFNPATVIEFNIPEQGWTELEIFNIIGQKVKTLTAEVLPSGNHRILWDGKDDKNREVTSGVYLYKLRHQETVKVKRMILLK